MSDEEIKRIRDAILRLEIEMLNKAIEQCENVGGNKNVLSEM